MQRRSVAATAYREHAMAHLDIKPRCIAIGIRYEPLVFTTQGECEAHAESVIAQIAVEIAKLELREAALIKAEMLQAISLSIARSVAKAVMRRKRRWWVPLNMFMNRVMAEVELQEPRDDE